MRRMRQDRRRMGAFADLSVLRTDALLRLVAESARQQTRAGDPSSGDCLGRTGRTLALLLPRRRVCGILKLPTAPDVDFSLPCSSNPRRSAAMSGVRVLVGTKKGAFILTSDGKRDTWDVAGPHFGGWEMYHLKGSPVDPNRIYASQSSGWFGQTMQRSNDGGKTWEPVGNLFKYEGVPGTHQWYDGTPHPWEFKRVWHLEPSLTDPDVVYAGVEDAALFRSGDGGQTWQELSGLRCQDSGSSWQPGAGGLCLHTIILDPKNPDRITVAISAAGVFRTDDGKTFQPKNRGLHSQYIPDPEAE